MSPDIIRPVATSTVGDIIALAHRLGMGGTSYVLAMVSCELRVTDTLFSTTVRDFGILLQFAYDPPGELSNFEA